MGIFSAAGLYILVSLVSPDTESDNRWKILAIAVTSAIVQAAFAQAVPGLAGAAVAMLMSLALVAITLVIWCGLARKTALIIAASYFVLCVGLVFVLGLVSPFAALRPR
jgi:hypothetical protein